MWSQMDEELHLDDQTPEHRELMSRLRKTLYYGGLKMPKCKVLTKPLSDLVSSETFFETHPQYSLKPEAVGQIKASPCSLILALIYLDLLKELDSQYVRRVPPSDLLLVAMMVSTKFYSGYDEEVYISEWAEYGNMAVDRLKALEIEFLDAMNWKLYVSNETFFKKLKDIERVLAERETKTRGWLTYTELCSLMPSIDVIRKAISYSALLAVSYTAGVIALAGAFFVASQVPGSYLCDRGHSSSTTTAASAGTESVASSGAVLSNETTTAADGGTAVTECRPGGGGPCLSGTPHLLTELEQRLILAAGEWEPLLSSADEEGKRIHVNRGTDYWTTTESEFNETRDNGYETVLLDELSSIGIEGLAHGIIRKRENESSSMLGIEEWSPFRSNQQHDLSLLSYLWLKFL